MLEPLLTVDEVAIHCGVDRDAVSKWIHSQELPAVNVNRVRNSKRPTWRIRPEDLQAFMLSRRTAPPTSPTPKRKKQQRTVARNWF